MGALKKKLQPAKQNNNHTTFACSCVEWAVVTEPGLVSGAVSGQEALYPPETVESTRTVQGHHSHGHYSLKTKQWAGRDHVCSVRPLGKLEPFLFFRGNKSVTPGTLHVVLLLWNYYDNQMKTDSYWVQPQV